MNLGFWHQIDNSEQEQQLTGYTCCIVGGNPNLKFIMVSQPSTPYVSLCIFNMHNTILFYILAHGRSNNQIKLFW